MRILTEPRTIESVGMVRVRHASIKAGPHILRTLAEQYRDPLWAVVREYIANAYDAYATCPERAAQYPIRVHLPNSFEPWFEVRDYGIGMSEDTLWNRYTVFGESDKQDDDVRIGGFGYGCKTAFAYKEGSPWTAISYWNGMRYGLAAYRDEHGMPTYAQFPTEPTDEPNGVAVRVPIASQHFADIAERVACMLPYAPFPIDVIGTLPASKKEILLRGSHFIGWRQPEAPQVVMGGVPYPMPWFAGHHNGLDLVLPIGAVAVTPSRDAIQETDATRKQLIAVRDAAKQEIKQYLTEEFRHITTAWEALKAAERYRDRSWLRDAVPGVFGPDATEFELKAVPVTEADVARALGGPVELWERRQGVRYGRKESTGRYPGLKTVFVVRDEGGHGAVFQQLWRESKGHDERPVLVLVHPTAPVTEAGLAALRGCSYEAEVTTVSELKRRFNWQPKRRTSVASVRCHLRRFGPNGSWVPSEMRQPPTEAFWVALKDNQPVDPFLTNGHMSLILLTGLADERPIFGLHPSLMHLSKQPGWIELLPWLKNTVRQRLPEFLPFVELGEYQEFPYPWKVFLTKHATALRAREVALLVKRLQHIEDRVPYGNRVLSLAEAFGHVLPKSVAPITAVWKKLIRRRPLLQHIEDFYDMSSEATKDLITYINGR